MHYWLLTRVLHERHGDNFRDDAVCDENPQLMNEFCQHQTVDFARRAKKLVEL